jgi:hypothetical protein
MDPFEDLRDGSSKTMSELARHVYDKAKQKANKSGNKHVRLQSVECSLEGDTVKLASPSQGLREGGPRPDDRPSTSKIVGGCIGTVALAALIFAIFLNFPSSASPYAPSISPALSSSTGAIHPTPDIGEDETAVADSVQQLFPIGDPSLEEDLSQDNIRGHLESLYDIAVAHGGNRAMGSSGYNASVHYIISKLASMQGFSVSLHHFNVSKNQLDKNEAPALSIPSLGTAPALDTDFSAMGNTGFGNITGLIIPAGVHPSRRATLYAPSTTGCNATHTSSSDFATIAAAVNTGLTVIALVERGGCFFSQKMENARKAGAAAILIYNANNGPVFAGTLGSGARAGDVEHFLPAISLSGRLGQELVTLYNRCPWPKPLSSNCRLLEVRVSVSGRYRYSSFLALLVQTCKY